VGEDGERHQPIIVHRGVLSTMERMVALLIEEYEGNFPLWLAPMQAVVIPIADRHVEYANEVAKQLRSATLRVDVDARNERMNGKIRDAQLKKVPYMLVVGDREAEAQAAAVRVRGGGNLGAMPVAEILARLRDERDTKALAPVAPE
jgi:threonyl-tRNA synthetase